MSPWDWLQVAAAGLCLTLLAVRVRKSLPASPRAAFYDGVLLALLGVATLLTLPLAIVAVTR